MKISHVTRSSLMEGGNLAIGSQEAQHLDLKVTDRGFMVPKLNLLLNSINAEYAKQFKTPLWDPAALASGEFLSGSSLHFFNVKGISDKTFVEKKPTVGDIDTMVDKEKEANLQQFLTAYDNKKIGPSVLLGFQRGNEQFSALFELTDPPIKIQIDFEFVEFAGASPTPWAKFSHSSAWEDLQAGVKGVFHKWLIQSFSALTRKQFLLRKMTGRGKLRQEEDVPTTDNMFSFAVSSKEGGGLRAKYEPVIDPATNKPLIKDGLPVMTAAPTSGYDQNINSIFSKLLGQRINPKQAEQLSKNFWSFTGLLQVMNTLMSPEDKQEVLKSFLEKTIGPGAQGMYKNNPEKDIAEKTVAINTMLKTLNMPKPANFDQMMKAYREAYKMTPTDEGVLSAKETVKSMAKNTLGEAGEKPNYKRQGIQHIYNPGSSTEIKDLEFIEVCKEIAANGGKLDGVPINLKVDGAGIRFGKDEQGKPFFMTSKVTEPKYIENYGDFEKYGRSIGQDDARLAFTKNYDEALKTILTSSFMKSIPPDTIVQAEMLYNPMAEQTQDGLKFVNIPYDPKKLGSEMTLVPFSFREYSTGAVRPDAAKIKKQLIADSNSKIKIINNNLQQKDIDLSKIVDYVVKNESALSAALKVRGDNPQKQQAKEIISKAKKAMSDAIITSPNMPGKDQLGTNIEGLVINMPSGKLLKVTSQTMKDVMAAKKVAPAGQKSGKTAVVTAGSFVGHKGHEQLVNFVLDKAKQVGGDPYVYISSSVGADDPIPPEMKLATWQRLYPEHKNMFKLIQPGGSVAKKIEKELVTASNPPPYDHIILMVGSDRYEGFKSWMDHLSKRMKNPQYPGFEHVTFDVVNTPREAGAGGTGISFTQLRNILRDPNATEEQQLALWMRGFDGEKLGEQWVKKLMDTAKKNMGVQISAIKEYIKRIEPLIKEATIEQKAKLVKLLSEAKKKLAEGHEKCPHCGGEMVNEELMNEKKDACYYKVKSRYKVWPSAYASGALVKCRKKGASNWGTKSEGYVSEDEEVDENLHQWFKEKWVRFGPDGKIRGACARGDDSEGKPKCLPQSKAQSLGKKGRKYAASKKRRADPNPERSGKAINVTTKKKSNEGVAEGSDSRGWIGNPAKWKEAVLQAHGPYVVFKNYSHPGQPGKRSVHAWDANGEIVGVYQRHNKMGMVQPNLQGVAEGWKEKVAAGVIGAAAIGGGAAMHQSNKEWARKNPEQAAALEKVARGQSVKPLNFSNNPYSNDTVPDLNDPTNDRMKLRNIKEQGVAESSGLSVEQLAQISDKALDDAYHYGRSTPGANFGWMANLQSATAAKRLIDAGETDIEAISDAIHKGWNITAAADYKGKLQLDTPTPEDKKLKRAKLAQQSYSQLPEEEKEKDRVVARAMLSALDKSNVTESTDYLDEK